MNKIGILIAICILLSSCVTRKACERKFPGETTDSIQTVTITNTIYRDTTILIKLPGDTVERVITIHTGSDGIYTSEVSVLKTWLAESRAWVEKGQLKHRLTQKDTTLAKELDNVIKEIDRYLKTDHVKIIKTPPANYLTGWQWFQLWLGRILGAVVLVFIVFKILGFKWLFFLKGINSRL